MTRHSRLTDRIYAELKQKIDTHVYPVGLRLPSELELCRELSVSRTVIRNALGRLRDDGAVETIRGSGAFVIERPGFSCTERKKTSALDFKLTSMADVLTCQEMRMLHEGELVYLAAQRWTSDDMQRMENALGRMVGNEPHSLGTVEDDLNFHSTLIEASHNELGILIYETMKPLILIGMNMLRGLYNALPDAAIKGGLPEHEFILNLVRDRKAAEARDAMHNHISYFSADLRKYKR